ncbi:MAG TPA: Fe-S cluster assembly protein SufD [Myxococcota bacterium]|nr:Fe-S cluster assembly protein SufD [Myxococcota bacterium]
MRGVPAERAFERLVRDPRAWDAFAERGLPTTRDEDWRFTSLAALEAVAFEGAETSEIPSAELAHARERVGDARLTAGELVDSLGEVLDLKTAPFALLNAALAAGGESIDVSSSCENALPFHLLRWLGAGARVASPRARIVVRAGASATVIEHFVGAPGSKSVSNSATELVLEPGARLRYVQLQELPESAFHVASLASRQAAGSRLELTSLALGARLSRSQIHCLLAGEGAELALDGLYLGRGAQHQDHHTTIDHAMPRTSSRELFKGILDGRAHGVFHGRVHVRPHAQKIDAAQTNRALLLSDGAVVDSKPQLEIYADDVKCSHGASVGQLDPDQLFYLRARGLDAASARALLTWAFASEVLERLPLPALRDSLEATLLAWLGGAP